MVGTLGEHFYNTALRGKTAGAALGIPLKNASKALDTVLGVFKKHGPFSAVVALRFVKSTEALLGFQRFAPTTCIVDLDGVYSANACLLPAHLSSL